MWSLLIILVQGFALGECFWDPIPRNETPDARIVGGENANSGEFPHQLSLQIRSGSSWFHICGAVLIGANKALSAAHCLSSSASSYRLVAGLRSMNTGNDDNARNVQSYTNHPQYNGNAAGYPNDIAVLRVSSSFNLGSSSIGSIALAQGSNNYAGQTATISGWGRLSGGGSTPTILQKVDMTVLTNNDCSSRWSGISGATINSGHICVFQSGKSACSGDSGGPMIVGNTLIGITSWGISSCSGSYPSVYTRVSQFNSWINSQ